MKSNTSLSITIASTIALLFSSCYTTTLPYDIPLDRQQQNIYYVPAYANAPLLKSKNDFSIKYSYGNGKNYSENDFQLAYVPAEHVGIETNLSISSNNKEITFAKPELAVGYIKRLSPICHFETYVGFAGVNLKNSHATGSSQVENTQLFIQPALSIHNAKNTLELGIASRFASVHFNVKDTAFNSLREPYSAHQLLILHNDPNHLFWEPAVTLKFGWEKFLFNISYLTSVQMDKDEFWRDKNNFSVGISFNFKTHREK